MSTGDERVVERLARAVADGTPVDWERESASHADLKPQLRQLRALEAMIALRSGAPSIPPHHDLTQPGTSERTQTLGLGLAPGQILGRRYEIRAFLGEGGMGEVWLAIDLRLRVEVALKTVRQDRLGDERALEFLRREVRAARQVASPHVCRIFDLVEADGQELVSMEYVDGTTLAGVLRERGPLDLVKASGIASQILAGLEAIHGAGLVHRDLKPGNVMITTTGRVVLMDFGLAKPVTGDREHSIVGTRPYMAPEQLEGRGLDARTDIFAAGVMLAEMIGTGGSAGQTAREALWADVREIPPRLPEGLWRSVLLRAVARDPWARHPSAQALARALEEVSLRVAGEEDRHPYPGLASFTEADAEFFVGREVEVEQMWRRLRWPHLQAVVGPSGAGKSSFLRAGLIPALPTGWCAAICTPGGSPMMSLVQALARHVAGDAESIEELLRFEDPDVVVRLMARWRRRHDQALLIVDQFEELFTQNRPEVQVRFAQVLGRVALEADVHVLLSMRDDFLFQCSGHPALTPIFSELTPLCAPGGEALRRALVQPALRCGYRFEDDGLVDEMLADVQAERGALPLLAFAVSRLWDRRDREGGLLTRRAYRDIGGVGGALAQHAEATLERIGAGRQELVRELFRNLVTAQGTRAPRDREELLSIFPDRERAEEVLRALVDARLLTTFEVQEGEEAGRSQRVEIIHESLLAAWPRLVRWRTQDADGAQLRDQLRQAAQLWQERGHPFDLLWTGTSYREFQVWRERYPGGLSATEDAFARAMVSRAERRRRQVRATIGGVFAALLGIATLIAVLWVRATNQASRADASRLFAFGQMQIDTNPTLAVAFAIASVERADNPEVRRFALDALERQPLVFDEFWSAGGHSIEFSPDGGWLAAGELHSGKALLFSSSGGRARILSTPGKHVYVKFGEQSDLLLTGAFGTNICQLWSIPDGRLIRSLVYGPRDDHQLPLFISSNRALVTASVSSPRPYKRARLLSWPPDGDQPVIVGELENINSLVTDPGGNRVAFSNHEGIYLLPLDDSRRTKPQLVGQQPDVWALTFDSSGKRLASGDLSGGTRVWAIEGAIGRPPQHFDTNEKVYSVRFDPTGSMLAVGHWNGKVRLWDLAGLQGVPPLELLGRSDQVKALAFHPNGRWLATCGEFQRIGLCPLDRRYPHILSRSGVRGSLLRGIAFAPDGTWVGASVEGGGLRRWDLVASGGETTEVAIPGSAMALAADPTGRYIIAGTLNNGVALIPLRGGMAKRLPGFQDQVWAVAFSPDGRFAAAGGGIYDRLPADRFIRVWDLEAGTFRDLKTEQAILYLAFLQNGRLLFTSGPTVGQKSLYSWTIGTDTAELVKENVGTGFIFDLSADRTHLLASSTEGALLHDLRDGSSRLVAAGVSNCRFNKGGTLIACGDSLGTVRVISLVGRTPYDLVGHKGQVNEVTISPDDCWIVSAGADGTLRLWPMPEGDPLLPLPRERFIARLRSFTNLRTVFDDRSPDGWRLEGHPPNPGWEALPAW